MSDDPGAYAELGVGITDSFAGARRMGEEDGLSRQHRWSMGYLDERAVGALAAATLLAAVFLPAYAQDWWSKAAGAAAPLAVGAGLAAHMWIGRRRLGRLREAQLAAHRRAGSPRHAMKKRERD